MARPLSQDLRERIVEAVEGGTSRRATARRFAVSVSAVVKLMQRWRRTNSAAPGQMGGWKDFALAAHEELVRSLVAGQPDLTLDELRAALAEAGVAVARSSVRRFLEDRQLTFKKRRSAPPSRAARMSRRPARIGASASPA